MRGRRASGLRARGNRGAVLVLTAIALPMLIGFCGLVIDVGNWFEHRRHLQVQADAGALAGGGSFTVPCSDTPIIDNATSYSGVDWNPQVGDPARSQANVFREFNSETWYDQTKTDPTVVTGSPCTAKMIDVKLTETDLPWFIPLFGSLVPYINAHARVEIRKQTTSIGPLPVGVPEVDPTHARAIFVDETNANAVIASTDLVRTGSSGGLAIWSNESAPLPVLINSARVGVRILLSGSTSTTCGDPLVVCYDAGSTVGLAMIRGWSATTAGTLAAPQVRGVTLTGNSCEDGYFTRTAALPCTIGVSANIDTGSAFPVPATTRFWVMRQGANANTAVQLVAPSAAGGAWTGGSFSIPAAGPANVDILYKTTCNANPSTNCNTNGATVVSTVHRTFAGNDARSGPIKSVRILEGGAPGANSFQRCGTCTHNLVVSIGIQGTLSNAQSVADPIVTLKVAGGGSQNQALDCDPDLANLADELAGGCGPAYVENAGTACPAGASALWATPEPWQCVAISTGATTNQVPAGLNLRILGDAQAANCTSPNNWSLFPQIPRGDKRVVELFLTPFGAFSGSGGTTVPVTGFATFYITGWKGSGSGFENPCQGNGDDTAGQGEIVGHFIKYIDTLNNGGAGEEMCDFDSFGRCVAVLTR